MNKIYDNKLKIYCFIDDYGTPSPFDWAANYLKENNIIPYIHERNVYFDSYSNKYYCVYAIKNDIKKNEMYCYFKETTY